MSVIYKSQYAKACELLGRPKPATQQEEEYCQTVEFEHPQTAAKVLSEMMGVEITKEMFPNTFYKAIKKIT